MQKPKMLRPGDRAAIVSLSSGLGGEAALRHRYTLGVGRLREEFGLEAVPMPNALKGIEYLDRHPEGRAADFMEAFARPDIAAVICMIGGDDTIRLLPYIDFDLLRANPKVFLGYSDSTVNHFMLHKAGVTSFYGPCLLAEFAENAAMHEYTKHYLRQTLFEAPAELDILPSPKWTAEFLDWAVEENNHRPRAMVQDSRGHLSLGGSGAARGPLLGGCLDVLPMLLGTELWPEPAQWQGAILFLETSEERMPPGLFTVLLRSLAAAGVLQRVAGILLGKPQGEQYFDDYNRALVKVAIEEAGRPELPVLANLNFGHNAPLCTLPYGVTAEIDGAARTLRLLEPAVEV